VKCAGSPRLASGVLSACHRQWYSSLRAVSCSWRCIGLGKIIFKVQRILNGIEDVRFDEVKSECFVQSIRAFQPLQSIQSAGKTPDPYENRRHSVSSMTVATRASWSEDPMPSIQVASNLSLSYPVFRASSHKACSKRRASP